MLAALLLAGTAARGTPTEAPEGDPEELAAIARTLMQGRHPQAAALLGEYRERHPDDPRPLLYEGMLLYFKERFAESLATFQELVARLPDFALGHHNLACVYHTLGRYEEALAAYERTLALEPEYGPARFRRSVILLEQRRFREAEAELRRLLQRDPNFALARFHLARLLSQTGRPSEAVEELHRCIERSPQLARPHYLLGSLLVRDGQVEEGRRELETYRRLAPRDRTEYGDLP